jgi:hypothetical protein
LKPDKFEQKLQKAWQRSQSWHALMLRPILAKLPLPMQRYDEPFLPFGKAIIDATRDLVVAYIFDLAAYLALGAAGAIALERTIAYVNASGETATILHGAFVSSDYVGAAVAFGVDAVTCIGTCDTSQYEAVEISVLSLPEDGLGLIPDYLVANGRDLVMADWKIAYAGSDEAFAEQARVALQVSLKAQRNQP